VIRPLDLLFVALVALPAVALVMFAVRLLFALACALEGTP